MTTLLRESVPVLQGLNPVEDLNEAKPRADIRTILVDDDDLFREVVVSDLRDHGIDVMQFASGAAMLEHFDAGNTTDIVVLDWRMPGIPGIDLMRRLRRRGINVPIVFLTGVPREAYEEAALDCGALDFVDKTRGSSILAKRLRLIAEAGKRPPELPTVDEQRIGRLTLKPKVCHAYWDGIDVGLTVTEFNIVNLLVSHAGAEVTYRALYDCVHSVGFFAGSGEDGYRTNIRSSVKRIRNKFRAIDADFAEIKNFLGFGYSWQTQPGAVE